MQSFSYPQQIDPLPDYKLDQHTLDQQVFNFIIALLAQAFQNSSIFAHPLEVMKR